MKQDRLAELLKWKQAKKGPTIQKRSLESTENAPLLLSESKADTYAAVDVNRSTSKEEIMLSNKENTIKPANSNGSTLESLQANIELLLEQKLFQGAKSKLQTCYPFPDSQLELYAQLNKKILLAEKEYQNSILGQFKKTVETQILQLCNSGNLFNLQSLKLIGKKRADTIIQTRETFGPYLQVTFFQH